MAHLDDPTTQQANLRYIRQAMDEPMLEREHELKLARRWKDKKDEKALHELIRSYTRLVVAIAAKFKNYGLPMGDLIQEGNIGLMEAAARFEPALENRFSTYATWWIRAQIQDYVLRNWSIVRTGTTASQKSLFFNLRSLKSDYEGVDTLSGTQAAEVAARLGVKQEEVVEMETRLSGRDLALEGSPDDGDDAFAPIDYLADSRYEPTRMLENKATARLQDEGLHEALQELDPRSRRIVEARWLHDGEAATLHELAAEFNVSAERIRQIEVKALQKMRGALSA